MSKPASTNDMTPRTFVVKHPFTYQLIRGGRVAKFFKEGETLVLTLLSDLKGQGHKLQEVAVEITETEAPAPVDAEVASLVGAVGSAIVPDEAPAPVTPENSADAARLKLKASTIARKG